MKNNNEIYSVKIHRGDATKSQFNRVYITKASGERELFDGMKIYRTAQKAGASEELAKEVEREIQKKLYFDISSDKILDYILRYLDKKKREVAIRYSLKRGIMELGPSGYSFEKYVGMILKEYDYQVKINQFIKGFCLTYEIDVLAEKKNKVFIVECKYHNHAGLRSDSKMVLYVHARFLDIEKQWKKKIGNPCKGLLITNTKCTANAIKYAECVGMGIIGWHYPQSQNLEYLIERKKLYPITCFPFLKKYTRNQLIANGIILAKDLLDIDLKKLFQKSGIPLKELQVLQDAAQNLYSVK